MERINIIGMCFVLCVLSGCGNLQRQGKGDEGTAVQERDVTESVQTVSEVLEDIPDLYESSEGCVTVHAVIDRNGLKPGDELVTATACLQEVDKDIALEELCKGETGAAAGSDYDRDDDVYEEEGDIFGTKSSQLFYTREKLMPYIGGAFRLGDRFEDYNADRYSLTDELAFLTREEAFSGLEDTLKKIGLDFEKEYHAYALDHETLASEEYHLDISEGFAWDQYKDRWSKEDECYYFCVWQTYRGIPVCYPQYDLSSGYGDDYYAAVQAVISKDGMEELNIDSIFTMDAEQIVTSLSPFEDVVKNVCDIYNQIPEIDTCEITQAALCYIVDGGQMKPAWVFIGTLDDGRTTQVVMDAKTGEEVVW